MGRNTQYVRDAAGWDAAACGPGMLAAVEATLRQAQAAAATFAPRSSEAERAYFADRFGPDTGVRYRDAFSTSTAVTVRKGGPRIEGVLRNDAGHAAAVEVGNVRVRRPHHVLARAAASLAAGG